MSTEYYTRLEQGRAGTPSPEVVVALARALRLDAAEREHFADLLARPTPTRRTPTGPQRVRPGLYLLLQTLEHPRLHHRPTHRHPRRQPSGLRSPHRLRRPPRHPAQPRPLLPPGPRRTRPRRRDWNGSPPKPSPCSASKPAATHTTEGSPTSSRTHPALPRIQHLAERPPRPAPHPRHQALPPPRSRRPPLRLRNASKHPATPTRPSASTTPNPKPPPPKHSNSSAV
ncbi:helix-turn-helix transcriptional regulator [Streptomyces halotolerans]|uniref:Helix-turn-helix transcriptional regulator n=1 Tax=Streptomyces pratisoli TaxID=3139917 RepID=A0ACC6Q9K2_9ACTN